MLATHEQIGRVDRTKPLVVRFAGDSGDGIQVLGAEFAKATARAGADFMTFPDYPAEIRAPAGTTYGVSAFQIQFGGEEVLTSGDQADVLVAFNPAALATNLRDLKRGGLLITDAGAFDARGLKKAGLRSDPLKDGTTAGHQVLDVAISARTLEALKELEVGRKQAARAKNFWVLGLVYWLFGRAPAGTLAWLADRFAAEPAVRDANITALKAGHAYAETLELAAFPGLAGPSSDEAERHTRPTSTLEGEVGAEGAGRGVYRKSDAHSAPSPSLPLKEGGSRPRNIRDTNVGAATVGRSTRKGRVISGTQAMALGVAAVAALSGREVLYCSYPITPASALLHALARMQGAVRVFQAEDEIAAACAAIGASYAGGLGITASSGPGLSLKTEALGLAVAAELPLIAIDVQRAGPSTGMPTKPEQSDLALAVHGRHGEAPLPVLAPATPEDCFHIMIEAAEIAISAMTPVIVLSDAYLANAASDWTPPRVDGLPDLRAPAPVGDVAPFARDPDSLARAWVAPGTPGLAHRIGGLEKQAGSGHISYDPDNHAEMVRLRAEKIARVARHRPPAAIEAGPEQGALLAVGWGSTHGAIRQVVLDLGADGYAVSHLHLRQLWPLPRGLTEIFRRFRRIVCPELNTGQLASILRAELLAPVEPVSQVTGQPFRVADLKAAFLTRLGDGKP